MSEFSAGTLPYYVLDSNLQIESRSQLVAKEAKV